jgi:formylglycine-generating enzyme
MTRAAPFLLGVAIAGCASVLELEELPRAHDAGAPDTAPPTHACDALPRAKADPRSGAVMVLVPLAGSACTWIDRTEVTVAQYRKWLADSSAPSWDSKHCAWKTAKSDPFASTIACGTEPFADTTPYDEMKPMRCVDWCDAEATCRFFGKRLCNTLPMFVGIYEPRAERDEWRAACGGHLQQNFPYGDRVDPAACRVAGQCAFECGATRVGGLPRCASPVGALDMLGNVREWAAQCATAAPGFPARSTSPCLVRGGDYTTAAEEVGCNSEPVGIPRKTADPHTGFRCCAELTTDEQALIVK